MSYWYNIQLSLKAKLSLCVVPNILNKQPPQTKMGTLHVIELNRARVSQKKYNKVINFVFITEIRFTG